MMTIEEQEIAELLAVALHERDPLELAEAVTVDFRAPLGSMIRGPVRIPATVRDEREDGEKYETEYEIQISVRRKRG